MQKEIRTVCYDGFLHIEAYRLEGRVRPFPDHFHDYYVIGFIGSGTRTLSCRNREYTVGRGDILLLSPNDSHGCIQCGSEPLDYRGLNISKGTMLSLTEELTGERKLPRFSENVIRDDELSDRLRMLHGMITEGTGTSEFEREETLLMLVSALIREYGEEFSDSAFHDNGETEKVCEFIGEYYAEHITLQDLCRYSGFSSSGLLRTFTKEKGVTPYKYLQAVRIGKAKELLEQGVSAADAAVRTGFSDQSHFSRFFGMLIGLSPAAYGRIFREDKKDE